MHKKRITITGKWVEITLTEDFHEAIVRHPLTAKVYVLQKTSRYHEGEEIHGLTLKKLDKAI